MLTPPYIAFRLELSSDAITVEILAGPVRMAHGEPLSQTVRSLEIMNELGLDRSSVNDRSYVLAMLNLWHPEVFRKRLPTRAEKSSQAETG